MKAGVCRVLLLLLVMSLIPMVGFAAGQQGTEQAGGGESIDDYMATHDKIDFLIWWAKKFHEEDALIAYLGEMVNADFQVVTIPHNVYFNQLSTKIASDDLPVMYKIQIPNNPAFDQLRNLAIDGMLEPLDDLTMRYDFKDFFNHVTREDYDYLKVKGKSYISPIRNGISSAGLYVRLDWMEQLGLEQPDDWDEFAEFLRKMKEANISGKVTAGAGGGMVVGKAIDSLKGYTGAFYEENGEWKHQIYDSKYKDAIKYIRNLYQEGLIHPYSIAGDVGPNEQMRLFIDGNVAVLGHNALPGHWKNIVTGTTQNDSAADIGFIMPYPAGYGGVHYYPGAGHGYYGGNVINKDYSEREKFKAAYILNYIFSDEGSEMIFDGIEGTHYKMEGGKKVVINPELRDRDFVGSVSNLIDLVDRSIAWEKEENDWLRENFYINLEHPLRPAIVGLNTETFTDYVSRVNEVLDVYIPKYYTGELDIDDSWDEMVADAEKAGMATVLEEVSNYMNR